ncbi:MAG TPA: ribonuclease P protein component [Parafilimonas sp.]|nr:ribonuclease P protein component [Parafilimonas sp.]
MAKEFSYNKKEKLKSKKQLDQLFQNGRSFTVFPLKLFYALAEEQDNVIKTGVGVSSRHFKKAVQRNRIKRLLREAYRTEKQPLHAYLNNNKKQLVLFLLFIDKELPQYALVKEKMKLCIQRLIHVLNEADIKNT